MEVGHQEQLTKVLNVWKENNLNIIRPIKDNITGKCRRQKKYRELPMIGENNNLKIIKKDVF